MSITFLLHATVFSLCRSKLILSFSHFSEFSFPFLAFCTLFCKLFFRLFLPTIDQIIHSFLPLYSSIQLASKPQDVNHNLLTKELNNQIIWPVTSICFFTCLTKFVVCYFLFFLIAWGVAMGKCHRQDR